MGDGKLSEQSDYIIRLSESSFMHMVQYMCERKSRCPSAASEETLELPLTTSTTISRRCPRPHLHLPFPSSFSSVPSPPPVRARVGPHLVHSLRGALLADGEGRHVHERTEVDVHSGATKTR